MSNALAISTEIGDLRSDVRHFSIGSKWLYEEDSRLDATTYAEGAFFILEEIETCNFPKDSFGNLCGTIWHPVQNQARSNFKRIYTKPEHGVPFVSSRNMFFLPQRPEKFLSRRMKKLGDLMVPEGWILLSRSGTVGNVLFVNKTL
jgi:type I restriction enzyme S subunit